MQARRHSAIWTVNRRAAGLDWKSSGRFGAGDQGLRCPPFWRVNRTGAPARLRTPMAPKGVRLRSSALRHERSRGTYAARSPPIWVTPSLGTERACKACAFVPAWFDSRVTHHHCGRSWKVEHLSATQENRFRLPTSAPSSPVSKSGDCTRLKNAGGQFKSGAGHHFGGRQRAAVDPCKIDVRSSTLRCSTMSFPSSHLGEGAPLLTEEGTFESCGGSQPYSSSRSSTG